jgi:hypothetical protein
VRVREGAYLPIHRRAISELIKIIGPHLHHLDLLIPELCGMHVGPADVILFHVRQLPLDRVWIPISLRSVDAVAQKPEMLTSSLEQQAGAAPRLLPR